jgi:hypothetical protein
MTDGAECRRRAELGPGGVFRTVILWISQIVETQSKNDLKAAVRTPTLPIDPADERNPNTYEATEAPSKFSASADATSANTICKLSITQNYR